VPNPDRVLLRKSTDGRYVEVGVLVERIKGKTWRLVLPDGSEVDHDIQPSEAFPERGSIGHRLRVDPEGLASALDASPGDVFMEVLSTFPKGAKAAQLKDALTGLDRRLVDKSWERAKRKFDHSPDVKRSEAKIPTYRLLTGPSPSVPTDEHLSPEVSPATSSIPSLSSSTVESTSPTSGPDDQAQAASSEGTTAPHAPDGVAESTDPLVRFLVRTGLTDPHESLSSLTRQPLLLGQLLGRVKAAELSELLTSLDEQHRGLLATVLGTGKEGLLGNDVAKLPKDAYEAALRAGLSEVARAPKDKSWPLSMLAALLERATASHTVALGLLIDLARAFADEARKRDQPRERRQHAFSGLQKSLESVARAFDDQDFTQIDMGRLTEAARRMNFTRTGGRSFLVATLYRKDPEQARGDVWWAGATFDQLVEAGHGPLATAMNDAAIAERVVRPLVGEALNQAGTRSRLGQIIAAPAPLARWVSGEGVQEAFLRTGNRDEVASAWAEVLSDTRELARMEARLSDAVRAVSASEGRQRDLHQKISHLEHRLQVTGEELAAARAAQGDVRGVHERQVRADLIRVLAKVAAQVLQSPDASKDEGLMRSVSHAATREGLDAIGSVGQRSTFDPRLHDPMGQMISPEAQVTVVRPGYTWRDGTEAVVLLKAQVVANGE
jgi:molecular chaperone GrpE (heat shock protein)